MARMIPNLHLDVRVSRKSFNYNAVFKLAGIYFLSITHASHNSRLPSRSPLIDRKKRNVSCKHRLLSSIYQMPSSAPKTAPLSLNAFSLQVLILVATEPNSCINVGYAHVQSMGEVVMRMNMTRDLTPKIELSYSISSSSVRCFETTFLLQGSNVYCTCIIRLPVPKCLRILCGCCSRELACHYTSFVVSVARCKAGSSVTRNGDA